MEKEAHPILSASMRLTQHFSEKVKQENKKQEKAAGKERKKKDVSSA